MSNSFDFQYILKNASEFDLQNTFNQLSMFAMNPPQISNVVKQPLQQISTKPEKQQNLVQVLSQIKGLKNTLRYIKLQPKHHIKQVQQSKNKSRSIINKIFIRPTLSHSGTKIFHLLKNQKQPIKITLNLSCPNFVLGFNVFNQKYQDGDDMIIAVEKKCLTLYHLDGIQIHLKDFDTVSLGKKFIIVDIKHINYNNTNYILVFGNQKQAKIDYFKCLVYQLNLMQLTLVKKAYITKNQIYSPTILFQNYPKDQTQSYCLIVGGCYDSQNSYYYSSLQVNMHLLLSSWLCYPTQLTTEAQLTKKVPILSGKALKYNDYWYIFCTQTQTINQLKLNYEDGIMLESIQIESFGLELKEKIYFSENSLTLTLKGTLKLLIIDRQLRFREKDFLQILQKFKIH